MILMRTQKIKSERGETSQNMQHTSASEW